MSDFKGAGLYQNKAYIDDAWDSAVESIDTNSLENTENKTELNEVTPKLVSFLDIFIGVYLDCYFSLFTRLYAI